MYTTLYLVRHGQTVFNTRGLIQGRSDSPLTDLGREQAWAAARWLRERGVSCAEAFSSPMERACATTELLWAGSYMRLTGLSERSFGELEGTEVRQLPRPLGDYPAGFGGESLCALEERLVRTMVRVMTGAYRDGEVPAGRTAAAAIEGCPAVAGHAGAAAAEGLCADGARWGIERPAAVRRAPVPGRSDAPIDPGALEPGPRGTGEVLAVSHGAACKAFAHAWEAHAQVAVPDPLPNCMVMVFAFDGRRFSLREVADPAGYLGGEGLSI